MIQKSGIEDFMRRNEAPLLDVRAPSEYARGHIPGAISFPLFSDDERAEVGTLYKQEGKRTAVLRGLEMVGPRFAELVRQAYAIANGRNQLRVYCWRGGMRSGSMAWLLNTAGLRVIQLEGGYKVWRNYALEMFSRKFPLRVLGGYTGSGKTEILLRVQQQGAQVLDLEALASHKGSSFGAIGMAPQPTQEHFENKLAFELTLLDPALPTWVEDESRMIGKLTLPEAFWLQKNQSPVFFLEVNQQVRIRRLVAEYAVCDLEILRAAVLRISKKLGGVRTKEALEALDNNDLATVAERTLYYYDKAYNTGLNTLKDPALIHKIRVESPEDISPEELIRLGA